MQDDDNLLRSFVTIKPAAEKIFSDGTDVDGTAKCENIHLISIKNGPQMEQSTMPSRLVPNIGSLELIISPGTSTLHLRCRNLCELMNKSLAFASFLRPYSIGGGKCSSFMADSLSHLFVVLFISVEWQIRFGFVCCPLVPSSIFTISSDK